MKSTVIIIIRCKDAGVNFVGAASSRDRELPEWDLLRLEAAPTVKYGSPDPKPSTG